MALPVKVIVDVVPILFTAFTTPWYGLLYFPTLLDTSVGTVTVQFPAEFDTVHDAVLVEAVKLPLAVLLL